MRYVKKFIICVFLSLVYILPAYSDNSNCDDALINSAVRRKWADINAQPLMPSMATHGELIIYQDTTVIQRYKARVPVLLEQYNNELERPLAGPISGTITGAGYYECEAGQTIKECDERVYLLKKEQNADRADRVARDEYAAYMISQHCGNTASGSGGGSTGERVSDDNAVLNQIANSKATMHVGATITVRSDYSSKAHLRVAVNEWRDACKNLPKTGNIEQYAAFLIPSGSNNQTSFECKIKSCTNGTTSNNGLSSCPATSSSGGGESGGEGSGGARISEEQQIANSKATMHVGATITVRSDYSSKAHLRVAVNEWRDACKNLPKTGNIEQYAAFLIPSGSNNQTSFECKIKSCTNGTTSNNGLSSCPATSSSGGDESGGTLLTGSVDKAPVVQSTDQGIDVKQTISNQTNAMSVGTSFTYYGSQAKSINTLMNQWNTACENLSRKPDRANTTGFHNTFNGNEITHTCIIKTCRGRGYAPSADGLSCVLAESGGTTTPASSSGGGSTPAPASSPPARSNTSRDDLADDNQMINDQINKSAGRGNMSRDGGGVSGRGIGAIITEINTSANNMKINAGFSYPESMVSTGGMQLQTAIANWIARCMEYPQGHESAAIKEMNHKKTTENGTVRHLCEIKSCLSEYMTPTEEGCKRDRTEIATLPSRSAPLIPTGKTGPDKLVYIGGSLTFTDQELNDSAFSDSVNNWERKCNSYPEDSDDVTINATYVKKDKHRKQNTWTCLIQSCNEDVAGLPQTPSPDGKSCISQDGSSCTAGDRHADRTRYDARNGVCIIETCKEDYTLVDGKCEKTRKLERQQARATTKLEKDFVSDITKLSEAFESVVKRLTKECEKSGGTINNGVCENAQTTGQQSKAPNNRRGSGRR